MKKALLFALFSLVSAPYSTFAAAAGLNFASGPNYTIPSGAYQSRARCSIEQSTRTARGRGWTDWLNEKNFETFDFAVWRNPRRVSILEDRGSQVTFTEIKERSASPKKVERSERVEEWTLTGRAWTLNTYKTAVTILRRAGGPDLRLEKHKGGRVFHWEVSADDQFEMKNLLNPELLNTKYRQIGLLRIVCQH